MAKLPTFKEMVDAKDAEDVEIAKQVMEKSDSSVLASQPAAVNVRMLTQQVSSQDKAPPKRGFDIVDAHALYALYPQFFKMSPDYAKIRQAIKLGIPMPGVLITDSSLNGAPITYTDNEGEENAA